MCEALFARIHAETDILTKLELADEHFLCVCDLQALKGCKFEMLNNYFPRKE